MRNMRFSNDFAGATLSSDIPCALRNSSDLPAGGRFSLPLDLIGSTGNQSSSPVGRRDSADAQVKGSVREILDKEGRIRKSTFGSQCQRKVKSTRDSELSENDIDLVRQKVEKRMTIRARLGRLTEYNSYKLVMAVVIIWNMVIGVIETDDRAADREPKVWTVVCSFSMLGLYALDILLRIIAYGRAFFKSFANLFDFAVVFLDSSVTLFSLVFGSAGAGSTTSMVVSFMRGLRMLRTFRVVRNFFAFRELYVMMQGFACAVRTLVFGLVLVFVVLTSWSILAVEVLHPINTKLTERGEYVYCERCQRAFQSVMTSNLTFIKGILAGDSWGEVSVPLMENSTLATVILVSVFVTLQWGLMNIMTAVIVDSQATSRARDDRLMAAVKQEELEESYEKLLNLFVKMDQDRNGCLNCAELLKSYKTNKEFRELLNLMDISSEDLPMLFDILDQDGSGGVSYQEFVKQLHTIKNFDSHTLLIFIKHMVSTNNDQMVQCFEKMSYAMSEIVDYLQENPLSNRPPGATRFSGMEQLNEICQHISSRAVGERHSFPARSPFAGALSCMGGMSSQESSSSVPVYSGATSSIIEYRIEKAEQKLDERMHLLQAPAVGNHSDAQVSQSVSTPALDTNALMTEWEKRLHQDLADIVAYASERVTLSGQWLQGNACAAPSGRLQSAACSSPNGRAKRDAGKATCETSVRDKAVTQRISTLGVDKYGGEQALDRINTDVQGSPAHESHFRPRSRTPKDVSVGPIFPRRHARPKSCM